MSWHTGTASDYLDLVDHLIDQATNSHISSVVVNAQGTGYAVGDIAAINGGTTVGGHVAAVEVLTIGGSGEALTVRMQRGGAYTANPGTGATTTAETGGGSGLTVNTTMTATGWTVLRNLDGIGLTAAALVAAGSGYSPNDILTLAGGTGTAATIRVLTVGGSGEVATFEVATHGSYTVAPTGTQTTTAAPPGGSGATFTGTYHGSLVGSEKRRQLILHGVGSGSDDVYIGLYSYEHVGTDAHNWELHGFTGYDAALSMENQPGISPGLYADQTVIVGGTYMLLSEASTPYWMSITGRRIVLVAQSGTTRSSMHMGWLDPFFTQNELPYPMYISGQTDVETLRFSSSDIRNSSIMDPISRGADATTAIKGVGFFRNSAGSWIQFKNSVVPSGTRSASFLAVVYPAGKPLDTDVNSALLAQADRIVANGQIPWNDVIPNTGVPGAQAARFVHAPGPFVPPIPCTLFIANTATLTFDAVGEMHGVYWVSGESGIVTEDTLFDAATNKRYRIFQSANRSDIWNFFALAEE